jgi:uncharacterized protein YndB with AHSA1/START domain
MDLGFQVFAYISKPVHEVFEAVADPEQLSRYFTTGGAQGRLEEGATVTWDFHDFPGAFPVWVGEVVQDRRIVIEWQANEPGDDGAPDYRTTVSFEFTPTDDGRTKVEVMERGWRDTPGGLTASYGNCMGWTGMLLALKAWLEHGIVLREGLYK